MSLLKLFYIFVKIGAILLGGGYVILPLLKSEFVERHKLITEEQLVEYFAISQSLPGIIAVNISIFVGYQLKKLSGGIIAVLGVTFAPFWTIVLLASLISNLTNSNLLQGVFWGVAIGVIILLISATRELWEKSITDKFSLFLYLIALFMLIRYKTSPAIIIIACTTIGILYNVILKKREGL